MRPRRGFGDETWRLARKGDTAALHHVADLLLKESDAIDYDGHRARAFAFALESRTDDALRELNEGWTEDWPFPAAYATDVGRVHFLSGDCDRALGALELAARGAERLDIGVSELTSACVRRKRSLFRGALRVAVAGGTRRERIGAVLSVLRAFVVPSRGQRGTRSTILPN